jgi:hypothetical protein
VIDALEKQAVLKNGEVRKPLDGRTFHELEQNKKPCSGELFT